ncbi:MAG: DUF4173 domain-containing protein [Oscillospiraceae bacterium]|nr:DUF4173 domain-containing protein [Oscillospiraceae bacterium]
MKENIKEYNTTDLVMSLLCFALGYVFIKFVLFNPTTLYVMFFNICFWSLAVFYIKKDGKSLKPQHMALLGLAVLFNLVYAVSSNALISFIGGSFSALLGAYILFISANRFSAFSGSFITDLIRSLFIVPFSGFSKCFSVLWFNTKKKKQSRNIWYVIIGLIIGTPVTALCAILLINADDSFRDLISNVINFGIIEIWDFLLRLGFGIPVGAYLFGMLFSNVKKENEPSADTPLPTHFVPVYAICAAVAPVCLLYIIFFISHFSYLTSALIGSLHADFSYAEYARQGFFELCAVAVINLLIIILLNILDKKENDETAKGIKFFTLFIAFSSVTLTVTALGKMLLYIGRYGLSPLRVYTSWFMVLLLICFIITAIRVFAKRLKIFRALFAAFTVMIGLLCFGDVDGIIADYNINAYKSGNLEELDVNLLYYLSDSAVKYAIPLADDEKAGEEIKRYLEAKHIKLENLEFNQYNYESLYARSKLREYFSPQGTVSYVNLLREV